MTDLSNNSSKFNTDDLDWLAFQYISNELSEQESEAFEELLAQKQVAREALAGATKLVAGLKSIECVPTVQTPVLTSKQSTFNASLESPFRSQHWALVSCAAVILLVTTFLLTKPGSRETSLAYTGPTEPTQEDLEHVLDLWFEASEESNITISLNSNSDSMDLIDQQNVLADNQTLEIPDWLYTAVSLPEESVN
ncbi:hypothetical protein [uncultured Gimesia sp.]|uniref:hypothetical protein n=1 Tax=uncultured Gimesia sp. TaxID=1678688 RepID=UPI002615E703|nr:hypothetical protein [uncultured Gimesia sp.]